jgi:tetratricopeptide (TPR) repeat protein
MTDSKTPADEPSNTSPEAPKVRPRASLRILARFGLFAGLFVLAIVASWIWREQVQDDPDPGEAQVEPVKTEGKKTDSAGSSVESLTRGDEALQCHFYSLALSYYQELLANEPAAAALVDYRVGLCHEALGQMDRAIAAYRKAISTVSSPALTCACHMGMARCLIRQNQPADARRLLYPFLFDEIRQQQVPALFVYDMRYLAALAMARQGLNPAPAALADDSAVSCFSVPLEIPFHLEDLGLAALAQEHKGPVKKAPQLVVRKRTPTQPAVVLTVDQALQPAHALFDLLAGEAGLRAEWSVTATKALADHSLRLCVHNCPLVDVLEQMADSFDLVCSVEDDVARFAARTELDPKRLTLYHAAMTGRALRAAIDADDTHAWASAAYLELGNGEAAQGKLAAAALWFERLIREVPNSPYVTPAAFNLARIRLLQQDFPQARQAFLRVIDHCPGHELALRAQIRVGQLFLEAEDTGPALIQLRRAQALALRSPYQPLASLVLAAAYLQDAQPDQARAVLAKQRVLLQKDPYKPAASFLDAYAQYRLAKKSNSGRREASELLSALWRDLDDAMLGPVGYYLIAQAYGELGFWDQAERLLRQVAPHTHGPIALGLECLLGDAILKQRRRTEAMTVFEKVAAQPSPFRLRARLQIARFDLEDKHFTACIQKCQELWAETSMADTPALLQLWGAALEGTGDFAKAAQCFAGKAPK